MTLLVGFFLLSILISFLCSIWEAVLLSITPTYTKRLEKENALLGEQLAAMKQDIDKPLSAILTLNTIAHTVGAMGVGAQAGYLFGKHYINLGIISLSYESIIATIMTLSILFLSEIIPKTIGANQWQSLSPFTIRSVRTITWVLKPLVWVSNLITRALKNDKHKSVFSKQDFTAMAEVISDSGEIHRKDYDVIKNILRFDDLRARDVMTPRTVMVMADEKQTLTAFYHATKPLTFSRIPLYRDSKDSVTGLLLKNEMLQQIIEGNAEFTLGQIKREVIMVTEKATLREVFEMFHYKREHLAIVADEYGGVSGLITLEDIIETLMGLEIMDETDSISDLQAYARRKWEGRAKKRGLIS